METKSFVAPDISCGHCVRTIERELRSVAGVQVVRADESSKRVTVTYDRPETWSRIERTLAEIGYPPAK